MNCPHCGAAVPINAVVCPTRKGLKTYRIIGMPKLIIWEIV